MTSLCLQASAGMLLLGIAAGAPLQAANNPLDQAEAARSAEHDRKASVVGSVRKDLHRYVSADADQDGLVTSAEAKAYFEARFIVMDADRDGRLSGSEFVRLGMAKRRGAEILGLRTGRFSKFEQLDLDRDGSVSPEEFVFDRRAREATTGTWAAREQERRQATFSRLDADGNGLVEKTSFIAAGAGYFEAIDLVGDGEVTIWEFLSGQRL
jgi:EF hand